MSLLSALSGDTYRMCTPFANGVSRPSTMRVFSSQRNAASVLPVPVGARMRVCSPSAIAGHPCSCGALGAPRVSRNQSRTIGWKGSSADMAES